MSDSAAVKVAVTCRAKWEPGAPDGQVTEAFDCSPATVVLAHSSAADGIAASRVPCTGVQPPAVGAVAATLAPAMGHALGATGPCCAEHLGHE